jgi:hypothetical protein
MRDGADTINGVRRGRRAYQRDEQFDWDAQDDLGLGRLRLRLRLPGMPIAAEQALPGSPWLSVGVTLTLLLAVLALSLLQAWFRATEPAKFAQAALSLAGMLVAGLGVWAGLWSLATKLFTGHPQFWRHVRIACVFSLLEPLVTGSAYLLAFSFSWESLARFNFLFSALVFAAGVSHLLVIAAAPPRHDGMVAGVTCLGGGHHGHHLAAEPACQQPVVPVGAVSAGLAGGAGGAGGPVHAGGGFDPPTA